METTQSILLAEFFTASGYLERLLFAFTEIEKIHLTQNGKQYIQKINNEIMHFIKIEFAYLNFDQDEFDWTQFRENIQTTNKMIENLLKLNLHSNEVEKISLNYINLIYRHCYELHNTLIETTHLEIQYPRTHFAQEEQILSINKNDNNSRAPLFSINKDEFYENCQYISKKQSPLIFLQFKREEKYNQFVHKGHIAISEKKFEEAKSSFYKARNYSETAEILTLIAWCYSLQDDRKTAKDYCMKAIQLDSQFGPAFNDYGNYLLTDGLVQESLRWFEIAKRAVNYQNREYPYINAGRAYVLLREFEMALNEFSLALTIAPHHEELHETITKLKTSLEKNDHFKYNDIDNNLNSTT